MQITYDAKEMFTSMDISWPPSVHNSRIWRSSQIRLHLQNKNNVVLLSDDGYGMEPYLMTPFINAAPGPELNYFIWSTENMLSLYLFLEDILGDIR